MTSTISASSFRCNLCGAEAPRPEAGQTLDREAPSCPKCRSTVRLRGLAALLSREIFGADLTLPEFPELKAMRAFGMSDPPILAERLEAKFGYTNTFYHQPPMLDVTRPPAEELGRYDFIVSSEVMEHVPPPIEQAFTNLFQLLKPEGLLVLTVPYEVEGLHQEHYPELFEYGLARVGDRSVLVNRRRDGAIETFEGLRFHGGDGSTLELRVFTEASLLETLQRAGFDEVYIASDPIPEFGIEYANAKSLPVVARKGKFRPPAHEIAKAYGAAARKMAALERELEIQRDEYARYIRFHEESQRDMERQLAERYEWVQKTEREIAERIEWAKALEAEKADAVAHFEQARGDADRAVAHIQRLDRELEQAHAARVGLEQTGWVKLGKKLGLVK